MERTDSLILRFGPSHRRLSLRWGETHFIPTSRLIQRKALYWRELILGNAGGTPQTVTVAYTLPFPERVKWTTLLVPGAPHPLSDQVTPPVWDNRSQAQILAGTAPPASVPRLRRASHPIPELGEVGLWIAFGELRYPCHFSATASIVGLDLEKSFQETLSGRDEAASDAGDLLLQPVEVWKEKSRDESRSEYGDASVSWPKSILFDVQGRNTPVRLDFQKPFFPEVLDRLGAQFSTTPTFRETSREEVEVEIESGVKARVMTEARLLSEDGATSMILKFTPPA